MTIEITDLLRAAGGSLIGKVRFQKIVYLLDQLGMGSEFEFSYHHYGPYSEELSNAVDFAVIFDEVKETTRARAADGVSYSIFELGRKALDTQGADRLGELSLSDARYVIGVMNKHSSTVLELAATIHWLAYAEGDPDWKSELRRRKGAKAASGRMEEALKLLDDLGLAPAA